MIDIQKIAREAGIVVHPYMEKPLADFAALYREAVVQELVAGSTKEFVHFVDGHNPVTYYTADQLAGAVLREREMCARICDEYAAEGWSTNGCAAAIRSGCD